MKRLRGASHSLWWRLRLLPVAVAVLAVVACGRRARPGVAPLPGHATAAAASDAYPLHTHIVATVFWVGQVIGSCAICSQVCSWYDDAWALHWSGVGAGGRVPAGQGCAGAPLGGCDGHVEGGACLTDETPPPDYFPLTAHPLENPYYLDLPFGQNDLKNRWVQITYSGNRDTGPVADGQTCYGQVEDAGPGPTDDRAYVLSADDARPRDRRGFTDRYGNQGYGMDVSPGLRDCLGFTGPDPQARLGNDRNWVDWRFVEPAGVPDGPWRKIVTASPVFHP